MFVTSKFCLFPPIIFIIPTKFNTQESTYISIILPFLPRISLKLFSKGHHNIIRTNVLLPIFIFFFLHLIVYRVLSPIHIYFTYSYDLIKTL